MGLLDAVALPSVKDGEVHDGILAQSTRFTPSETSRAGELNRDSVIAGGACGPAGEDNSLASVRPPAVCPASTKAKPPWRVMYWAGTPPKTSLRFSSDHMIKDAIRPRKRILDYH
jgi:hypothetical protein